MRTSKKEHVLRSAITIVEKQGLAALTYESLAAESGLSKSGLIYYFPSRQTLLKLIQLLGKHGSVGGW